MTDPDPTHTIRVVLVDDHRMFVESLARLLFDEPNIAVVGVAAGADEGLEMVLRLKPDVVLVDYHMPVQDGAAITAKIKSQEPAIMVIVLTGMSEDRILVAAIEAGCSGFITKDRASVEVAGAVRAVAAGEMLIAPATLLRLLPMLSHRTRPIGEDLSQREREILTRLAKGWTNRAVADSLFLSVNTIRNYIQSILTKLGAHSKLEAVATAVREKIIDFPMDD